MWREWQAALVSDDVHVLFDSVASFADEIQQDQYALKLSVVTVCLNARDTIDHAVVHLDDEREAIVLEALDDPEFPERSAAIQVLGKQSSNEALERALVTREREPRVPQVEVHVEAVVIDPDRVAEPGHPLDPLAIPGNRIDCGLGVSA